MSNNFRMGRGVYNATYTNRSCSSKRQFESRQHARAAAARVRKSDRAIGRNDAVEIYRCKVCGYLHVGHAIKS